MADNINVSERNTLPVLYNINVSTVILPPRQHYIYIYLYFRNMKPYNERKMKTKNGRQYKCFGTQYFACTLQYKCQYSYTTAASTLYIYISIFP